MTDPHLAGAPKLHREALGHPAELIIHLRLVEAAAAVAVAVVVVSQEEIGTARVGDAETQTRTFRHHAGKLIAVILTTVKAGVTDPMDSTITHARRRGVVLEGIFTRGTIVVRDTPGRRIGNGGVTVGGSCRDLGPGRGLGDVARGIEPTVPSAGLTHLLHTRNKVLLALDRVREAPMNPRGHGQGPRGKTAKTATALLLRTEAVAEDQQGSAMNVYRIGHMLIRGRNATEVIFVMRHAIAVAALWIITRRSSAAAVAAAAVVAAIPNVVVKEKPLQVPNATDLSPRTRAISGRRIHPASRRKKKRFVVCSLPLENLEYMPLLFFF